MEQENKEQTPEEQSALEVELAKAKQALSIYEKVLQAKDEEIRYLRELLRIEMKGEDSETENGRS